MLIKVGLKEMRQCCMNQKIHPGFYLSESALKDLGLICKDFPCQMSRVNTSTTMNERTPCGYRHRTMVPDNPTFIPFLPINSIPVPTRP